MKVMSIFGTRPEMIKMWATLKKLDELNFEHIMVHTGQNFTPELREFFFKLKISDILYTFVIGDTSKAKLLNILSTDFRFCVELPIKAKRNNFKLDVFPSYERKRIAGKKKVNAFKDGSLILKKLIELFFNK